MKLIHMIRRRVARIPNQAKAPATRLAELLRAHRTLFQYRTSAQPKSPEKIIGRFGRARESTREDFRVRNDKLLSARDGVFREAFPDVQLSRFDFRFQGAWLAVFVAGVNPVDTQHRLSSSVDRRCLQQLTNGAAACAPSS